MSLSNIKAIIIDDERHCRSSLRKQLEWSCPQVEIIAECANASKGEEAIQKLEPELVFLDVEMPDKNGFDLLKSLDDINFEVVFTTAYDGFAIEAFRANAIDYLLKPIDEDHLIEAVDKVEMRLRNREPDTYIKTILEELISQDSKRTIPFPTSEGITFINIDDLIRCEAEGSYSYVYYGENERLFISKTLKHIEALCKSRFLVRVHQSHLININKVKQYIKADGGSIVMQDNSRVPLARSKKENLRKWIKKE